MNGTKCLDGAGRIKATYKQVPGEPKIGGAVQGKGDVTTLFMQHSLFLLNAHKDLATGIELQGKDQSSWISEQKIQEVVKQAKESAYVWKNLTDISGHSLAFQKMSRRL